MSPVLHAFCYYDDDSITPSTDIQIMTDNAE